MARLKNSGGRVSYRSDGCLRGVGPWLAVSNARDGCSMCVMCNGGTPLGSHEQLTTGTVQGFTSSGRAALIVLLCRSTQF